MIKTLRLLSSSLIGLLLCTACGPASRSVVPIATPSMAAKSLPTPIFPGKMIIYNDLQVEISQAEITTSYLTEYGSGREPPAGQKFLWVHINLKNSVNTSRTCQLSSTSAYSMAQLNSSQLMDIEMDMRITRL